MNLLPEKRVPSRNFVKKNVLCEKGDEITRFDGTLSSFWTQSNPVWVDDDLGTKR